MSNNGRLRFLSIAVIVVALLFVAKLYEVQILRGDLYRSRADRQYVEGGSYFDRGTIYFSGRDGSLIPAAGKKRGYILAVDPQSYRLNGFDKEAAYNLLNSVYPIEKSDWDEKLSRTYDPYEELGKRLPEETADAIRSLGIPGISLYGHEWRIYPGGSMAAHVLGLMGYGGADDTEYAGRYGLERYYEPVLARSGDKAFVNFFAEVFSDIKKSVTPGESPEGDIITTIEPEVESILEDELASVQNTYGSDFSGGIVMDPNTGEILAMALSPSFDPNSPQGVPSLERLSNKLVEDRYEMGSIVKALTMAAGLDSGAVTRKTTYADPGCQTLDKKTFCNYDGASRGPAVSMQHVLSESLNTGAAFVVSKMGNSDFREYMLDFGLGEKTGIDLPSEGLGLISNLSSPRDLEYAVASFGQGVAFTPVQMVRALATLGNGGYLVTPHLVKEVKYEFGISKDMKPKREGPIFKSGTSEEISRMLTEVVDYALKGGRVRLQNHSIAAKTGTAQIADPETGGYYADRYLHSFFGYFPSYDPQFIVFLYTYYPKGVQYASETLTDSFMDIAKFLIGYYNVPPDREAPPAPTITL